ncbi:hypothetical protein [Pseudonocardia xishanensis]|uniref:Glyoxalase-like domain-containing protein n=1 Tax=Pseudonocardia xishanensis TaxID=630995 RepID=A0ABP8S1R0_9PSEU
MALEHGDLEAVTIEVGDVSRWTALFEDILGSGFEPSPAREDGKVAVVHPAGVTLLQGADFAPASTAAADVERRRVWAEGIARGLSTT